MATILAVNGIRPQFGKNCFIAINATITGDVICGDNCSFWFNSVTRGDVHTIRIGNNVNIQDGAIIHCTYKKHNVEIGNNVSIAHRAMVHGCKIHDNVLIGMGAIIMDGAIIESNSIIAAGAIVTQGTIVPAGSLFAGIPAKKIKDLDENLILNQIMRISESYPKYGSWYGEQQNLSE